MSGYTRKNPVAVALGRMAAGVPKKITPAERVRRRQRAAYARAVRARKLLEQKKVAKAQLNVENGSPRP